MDQQRILVVEDDPIQRLMFAVQLQQAGYNVVSVESGEEALDLLSHERFDLLITDLLLPQMDGMQLIAEARSRDGQIAVIIITGTASTASAIAALNQQVHRYLTKPVTKLKLLQNVAEVLAQRQQIAERSELYQPHSAEASTIQIGPLQISPQRHRIDCDGAPISLTSTEFALLVYLTQHRGSVVSHLDIARNVQDYACSLQEARDLAKSLIHRLRQKIGAIRPGLRIICTVRGAGYRLLDEDEIC